MNITIQLPDDGEGSLVSSHPLSPLVVREKDDLIP